jgi:hypothetical protein
MKYLIILFIVAFVILNSWSCTKCTKCIEKSAKDSIVIVEYPETCGNWRDISVFEKHVYEKALVESNVQCIKKSKIPFIRQ